MKNANVGRTQFWVEIFAIVLHCVEGLKYDLLVAEYPPAGLLKLKLVTVPCKAVKYCRHPGGPPISLPQANCSTLMSNCLLMAPLPKAKLAWTQSWPLESTNTKSKTIGDCKD